MSRATRAIAIAVGAVAVLLLGSSLMVAGTLATGGLLTVSVHEAGPDGIDLFIPVPAGLVEGVLALTPVVLRMVDGHHVNHDLERFREELDILMPALEAALEELETMPSATLVEVVSDRELVRVRKVRGAIEIEVEEDDTRVRISVPTRVFRSIGGFLAG